MDKVSSLYAETTSLYEEVKSELVGNDQQELLMKELKTMELMLSGALYRLEEIGGFGALDKEVCKSLRSGFDQVGFLILETRVLDQGDNKSKIYLRKLAKDALRTFPSFGGVPEIRGELLVEEVDSVMFEKHEDAEREIRKYLMLPPDLSFGTNVSYVFILGRAGVGKTSLVHLILKNFYIRQQFDIKILVNISALLSGSEILDEVARIYDSNIHLYKTENFLQSKMEDKKFLLILEDLFDDGSNDWFPLLETLFFLTHSHCKYGSKILVTSRSTSLTKDALGGLPLAREPYILQPLDHQESLPFFISMAFGQIAEQDRDPHLIEIGVNIFNKCANNLHVIKIIASLLSSQPVDPKSWQYFNDVLLASIQNPVESIQSIVDLTQARYKLGPKFLSYTALFPSDHRFLKADLLPLWELQGSIIGPNTSKEFNEYIDKLLANGYFLENIVTDKTGDTIYYKVNSLLHDVMNYLTKDDWCFLDKATKNVDEDIVQHVSFMIDSSWETPSWLHSAKQLKTLFFFPTKSTKFINIPKINEILLNMKALQALDLVTMHYNIYPDFLGKLRHLRYLRLGISIDSFPECITNLRNLLTLDLRHTIINELPTNFNKLSSLKFLYTGCRLIDLPPNFGEISSLQTLDEFIVGKNNGLDQLDKLTYLAGKLKIRYQEGREKHTLLQVKENCLVDWNLDYLSLTWSSSNDNEDKYDHKEKDASEFEFLQPPPTLESLSIKGWKGVMFPKWAMDGFSILLKSLVFLQIVSCSICQGLPSFNSLPNLRSLRLQDLPALEWVEIPNQDSQVTSSDSTYFPSLKYVMMANLPQLKGWSNVNNNHQSVHQHETFECLIELKVIHCPMMMSMPLVLTLEKLEVVNVHKTLLKHLLHAHEMPASSSLSSSSKSSTLEELHIKSVHQLESLIITISCLQVLAIRECKDLAHVFVDPTNTLKRLQIQACLGIKHVSQIMRNLTVLEELEIDSCQEADPVTDDSTRVAWQDLKSLRSMTLINISRPEPLLKGLRYIETLKELYLCWLYNLTVLPESISHLTGLSRLVIRNCPKTKRIPEYFSNLKSLNRLEIKECWRLQKRCEQPDGEDCHLIQHILPGVYLG